MKKGAKYVIMIPGGFNETKTEEGRNKQVFILNIINVQKKLVSLANQYQCRIIGPNCMGVFDPSSIDTLFVGEEGYSFNIVIYIDYQNQDLVLWVFSPNQVQLLLLF